MEKTREKERKKPGETKMRHDKTTKEGRKMSTKTTDVKVCFLRFVSTFDTFYTFRIERRERKKKKRKR